MSQDVERFLVRESRLLDACDWDAWLAAFAPDGVYWMPAHSAQRNALDHVSLIHDDAPLRALRCRRFRDRGESGALSLQPFPRSLRYLSQLEILEPDAAGIVSARANLIVAQYADARVDTLYASVRWNLVSHEGRYLIRQKRVDLLNADGPLSDILVYL